MIQNSIAIGLMLIGFVFLLGGTVGILRFPDFYSRLHAAGKLDTLGSLAVFTGLVAYNQQHLTLGETLTSLKILMCMVFVFLASPTATHAIVDAGMAAGLMPWKKPKGMPKG